MTTLFCSRWPRQALLLALLPCAALAQTPGVGIGTTTPAASAVLDVSSTTQGLLPPRLTAAQRQAIASPAPGLLVYQTNGTVGVYYYAGTAWVNAADGRVPDSNGSTLPANGGVVSTYASSGQPGGVAVDAAGTVYVANQANHLIRKVTPAGVSSVLAGSGTAGSANGTGTAASFNNPTGLAADANGTVYVADQVNNLVRQITPAGVVTTLAGSGTAGSANGTGTAASFNSPTGIAVDAAGTVYVADRSNGLVRRITPAGVVTTLASGFSQPSGVAVDAGGTVYVTDRGNNRIRKITQAGVVSTLAGSGTAGSADGTGTAATFNVPFSVAVNTGGTVYVTDRTNNLIRQITPTGVVTTLAGSGAAGSTNGTGTAASFNSPIGVAVDASGAVYVADQFGGAVRVIK